MRHQHNKRRGLHATPAPLDEPQTALESPHAMKSSLFPCGFIALRLHTSLFSGSG